MVFAFMMPLMGAATSTASAATSEVDLEPLTRWNGDSALPTAVLTYTRRVERWMFVEMRTSHTPHYDPVTEQLVFVERRDPRADWVPWPPVDQSVIDHAAHSVASPVPGSCRWIRSGDHRGVEPVADGFRHRSHTDVARALDRAGFGDEADGLVVDGEWYRLGGVEPAIGDVRVSLVLDVHDPESVQASVDRPPRPLQGGPGHPGEQGLPLLPSPQPSVGQRADVPLPAMAWRLVALASLTLVGLAWARRVERAAN